MRRVMGSPEPPDTQPGPVMANLKMTFGKYKGKRINKLPTEYLTWCLNKCDTLTDEYRTAIEEELAAREGKPPEDETDEAPEAATGARPPRISAVGQSLIGEVRMLFRNMAFKYHPDRGGSDEAMQALNDFHDQVQELLTRTFSAP
jgi:Putative quorum-sensing-regulated virulence factor